MAGGTIAPGNSIGTLTIAGNYTGNNGLIEIEAELGDDTSATDRLIITGNTSGTARVQVKNVGGNGAPTSNGIKIVDVGGASNGVFTLMGAYQLEGAPAVVGGAYAYRLYKDGISAPDGDWYLRSSLVPPSGSGGAGSPLYQAGVPLYESYANVLQSFDTLKTMQQRIGNRSWTDQAGVVDVGAASGTAEGRGLWGSIDAGRASFDPAISTTDATTSIDTWKLHAGVESLLYGGETGRLVGGITAHYGTLSANIASPHGNGSISGAGYGLGTTLTLYADSGFYFDAQAQLSWFDSDLRSTTAALGLADSNDGFGYAASLEAGQRIVLGPNWSLTPQAQLAYSAVDFGDFTDAFGAPVSLDQANSLKIRLGVSTDYENEWQDSAGDTSRSHAYAIANLYYDTLGEARTDVAGTTISAANDPLWGGLGLGGSYSWNNDKYALHGEAAINTSLGNFADSYSATGTVGFTMKW